MTPEQGLLDDIREHPDDDVPRLVCADWYEENGQAERAEFIRVQVQLARAPFGPGSPALRRRAAELLKKNGRQWRAPLKKFSNKVGFFRGFADHMVLHVPAFLAHAEDIFRLAPLSHVKFRLRGDDRDLITQLAGCPSLAGLTTIDFQANKLGGDRLAAFFASPHLTRLRHLKLGNNGLGNKGAAALARSPLLGRLHSLDLTGNDIGVDGLAALASSEGLANLRSLELKRNLKIHGDGVAALAGSPHVRNLQTLGLGELQRWAHIPRLDSDIEAVAGSPHLLRLETLDLSDNPEVDDRALLPLALTDRLPRLSALLLSDCSVELGTRAGAFEWLGGPLLGQLRRLDLNRCEFGAAGIRALVAQTHLKKLRVVDLSTPFGAWPRGLKLLADAAWLKHVTALRLAASEIKTSGAQVLAANSHLANLEVLDLSHNEISPPAARALLRSPHLTQAVVCLSHWRLAKSYQALQAEYPERLDLDTDTQSANDEW
jgi:uncharacterized protein (TIGR02996 family)